jgi:hypothetical protein
MPRGPLETQQRHRDFPAENVLSQGILMINVSRRG